MLANAAIKNDVMYYVAINKIEQVKIGGILRFHLHVDLQTKKGLRLLRKPFLFTLYYFWKCIFPFSYWRTACSMDCVVACFACTSITVAFLLL